ncbi:TonB-dependent receptor [Marinihelvus fidelis]|uniref:TonB-dependent receptor n=1 Tax=Marinihelvus fidelis TaxID=2613842 RepID=A0A5N0T6X5_9GAMM|nr:TonB-dependent receptor [Marinihelvus fidelis]KAA9129566.1 TonB-dependent receptor [Marinihelvus fidelis]
MYHNKNRLSLAVKTALGFTTMVTAGAAMAQEQSDAEEDFAALEEVIVTGSRIVNPDGFSQTSPVTVVGMEQIEEIGFTRVEDVLNQLPQIEANQTAFIANGSSGTANIDLRGMGANRTLVLVNGRRLQPGGLYSNAPDVNQIPTSMIERVEVLTGGASATYGADAVAGVVNFIMRKVNGVEFSMGASGYQHDNSNSYIQNLMDARNFEYPTGDSGIDGKAYNFDLTIGGDFADGRGNASAYITYRTNEELRQSARDYSSCALGDSGQSCGGSANAAVPNFFIAPLTATGEGPGGYDYDQEIFVTLQSDSSLQDYDGSNVYNFAPINHFMRPDDRWSGGAFIDFEINEHAIAYAELGFADNRTKAQIAESGTFFFEPYPLTIDNPQFPDAFRQSLENYFPGTTDLGIYIGKRNVEGGPRTDILQHTSFRIVGGLKGAITDNWDYDVSYLYGQTTSESIYINDFFASNVLPTIDGSCVGSSSCEPWDVFTFGGVTPSAAAQLAETGKIGAHTSTTVINGYVTGDLGFGLPAGDIFVVAGAEYREEVMERIADLVFEKGLLLGQGGPTPSVDGNYSVNELFAEANIPLLSDLPLIENLTLDMAYRWSDYDTTGDVSTYRVGLDWAVTDWARVRTGYNRAVRAPNVFELFLPQNLGLWGGVDPCAGATPELSAAQCANTGVTPAQYGNITLSPASQYNALYGGNPDLDPEDADTFTFGVVFQPTDTMQLSIDYWDIEIEDTIANIDPELMVTQCAVSGILCDNVVRSGSGSLWQGQNGYVIATNVNLGSVHYEGVDLAWAWSLEALAGTWNFDFIGTYMLTKETAPLPTDDTATYDCVGLINTQCFPTPEWRHVASATYDSDEWWAVTARWRFYQDVEYDGSADLIANDSIDDESYFDATAIFRFMESNDLVLGVNNILDEEPPMVGGSLSTNANTIAGFYDTLGRYLFANVTFRY